MPIIAMRMTIGIIGDNGNIVVIVSITYSINNARRMLIMAEKLDSIFSPFSFTSFLRFILLYSGCFSKNQNSRYNAIAMPIGIRSSPLLPQRSTSPFIFQCIGSVPPFTIPSIPTTVVMAVIASAI